MPCSLAVAGMFNRRADLPQPATTMHIVAQTQGPGRWRVGTRLEISHGIKMRASRLPPLASEHVVTTGGTRTRSNLTDRDTQLQSSVRGCSRAPDLRRADRFSSSRTLRRQDNVHTAHAANRHRQCQAHRHCGAHFTLRQSCGPSAQASVTGEGQRVSPPAAALPHASLRTASPDHVSQPQGVAGQSCA